MGRFDFGFFGGWVRLLLHLASGWNVELATGITPSGAHATSLTPAGATSINPAG